MNTTRKSIFLHKSLEIFLFIHRASSSFLWMILEAQWITSFYILLEELENSSFLSPEFLTNRVL